MSLIECRNVAVGYDGGIVAGNINFSVEEGDYISIIGDNGAGKSTLMKSLLGLIAPMQGEIIFGAGLKKTEIGYLPQQTQIQKDFPASSYEVVLSGSLSRLKMNPFYSKKDRHIALHNMEVLGITDLKSRCYRELSGGQQQRVLLARALCATKKLLVLDEPIAGLDPNATIKMYDVIAGLNKNGIAVVAVTHDIVLGTRDANKILHVCADKSYFYTKSEFKNTKIYDKYFGGAGL